MKPRILSSLICSFILISFSQGLDGDTYDFFLPNGLKVILMEKHAAPKVAVSVFYNVGSHDEAEGQKGITRLIKYIINEGTINHPILKVDKMKTELQAKSSDDVNPDRTYFVTEIPVENIEFILDLESERMQNIIVTEEILNNSKAKYKEKYNTRENNNPFDSGLRDIISKMFPEGHPYRTNSWGIIEQIDTLSIQTCQQYYNTYFSPNNSVLIIVGNIVPENVTKLIYKYFNEILPSQEIPPDPDLSINNIPKKIIEGYVDYPREPLYFSLIGINFFTPSSRNDDVIVLEHFSDILERDSHLPGYISKKFTKNNRLMFRFQTFNISGLGTSQLHVLGWNAYRNGSLNKITQNMLNTFEFIGENGIDEKVLKQHKKYKLLKNYQDGYRYSYIAKQLGNAEIINGDYRFYDRKIEILKNLSNEDIKRVVNTYLISDNMATFHLSVNEKSWSTPIKSFFTNQIILRFWTPRR